MRQHLRKFRKLTGGERARALAFVLVGIYSAILGYLAVLQLDQAALLDPLNWSQIWIVVASSLGGMISLYLAKDRMGQSGPWGAVRGLAGAIWVTFIGALIGGTLALPMYGTMFGPFIVAVTLVGAPILALFWAFSLIGIHLLLGIYQRERDSIFAPSDILDREPDPKPRIRINGRR